MQVDREQFLQELKLRKYIRSAINIIHERRAKDSEESIEEEIKLRKIIRNLIQEAAAGEEDPERSTGINALKRVLEQIVPILEQEFKQLTTDKRQRESFRSHVLRGIQNLLATERVLEPGGIESIEEEVDIEVVDTDRDGFLDVRDTGKKKEKEAKKKAAEEEGSFEDITGEDETGRNFARHAFEKVENQILRGYTNLENQQDKDEYYDYLITNLNLHFDDFESELQATVPPVTTPEYEQAKAAQAPGAEEAEEETELEPGFEF